MNQIEQLKAEVRGALARGYCTKENENKVLDPELIEAMALEIDTLIETVYQAAHSEGVRVADADGAYHSGFLGGIQVRTEEVEAMKNCWHAESFNRGAELRTEEVRNLALRWYDENYKHGKQEDGSTTYITEKEFDDIIATLKDTTISKE